MSRHNFEPKKKTMRAEDGTEIKFCPWDADDYLHAFVKGDPNDPDRDKFCLNVYVVTPNKEESAYYAALSRCSQSAWVQFIEKFVSDPKYRQKFLIEGKGWDGTIKQEKTDIHPKCASAIAQIEKTKESKLKFHIFANLKTFGQDAFSRKKTPELEELLGEKKVTEIKADERMEDDKLYAAALKWCARGLSPNHAVRKVLTDQEVAQNARGHRKRY